MQGTLTTEQKLAEGLLLRLGADLGMILDRPLVFDRMRCERVMTRAAGSGSVHVSFRVDVHAGDGGGQGCVLVPLPDAMALAACLMMAPDEEVEAARAIEEPGTSIKDALLEIDNFIASAFDAAVRELAEAVSVQPAGCQGVRAGVRPALLYEDGDELLLVRAHATFGGAPSFEMIVMLPTAGLLEEG